MDEPPQKRQKTDRGGRGNTRGGRGGRGGRGRGGDGRNNDPQNEKTVREVKPPDWWKALCPPEILAAPLPAEGTLPSEIDFGVSAYLDPDRKPFQAVFKQRYEGEEKKKLKNKTNN